MADQTLQRVDLNGGVAVGVDGSGSSLRALELAEQEAALRGVVLHVVRAWGMRNAPRPSSCPNGAVPSVEEYAQAVREDTERLIADRFGERMRCPVEVHVAHAPAVQGLLSASEGADLLVVGHRGRGGFGGLMLGSVAEQCVRHASCPVLVIRPQEQRVKSTGPGPSPE